MIELKCDSCGGQLDATPADNRSDTRKESTR
jgi:hypothetical protein